MKKLMRLCMVSTMIATLGCASAPKVTEGSSVGKYAKPGAPVDIHYISQNVESGESAEVKIDLLTSADHGRMSVSLRIDPALHTSEKTVEKYYFDLRENKSPYTLVLHLSAEDDGVYYIRLMVTIEGKGSRAFAVPLFVGEGRGKKSKQVTSKSAVGENLSVSKAVESRE